MGTTFCSIHVYTMKSVAVENLQFKCLSHGWQTYLPQSEDFGEPEKTQRLAKAISKSVAAPILWFYLFDSDFVYMKFYMNGKQTASYSDDGRIPNKNLYQIPELIGAGNYQKRRFSRILSCSDTDFKIKMLEEFFGVCLMTLPQLFDEGINSLSRTRDDKHYKEFVEAEMALTGKRAKVQIEQVQELEGVLDNNDWEYEWFPELRGRGPLPHFKMHYYLYRKGRVTGAEYFPVHFNNGEVAFISQEEMRNNGADRPYPHHFIGENAEYKEEYSPDRLIFAETAPVMYAGKELKLPHGFYGLGFDGKNRLVLYDSKSTVAIIDENMKMISKQRLKGDVMDIDGDYILTVEDRCLSGVIRVYRIFDK